MCSSDLGTIQKVGPNKGQQGTVVTITGTTLLGGGTAVHKITLAGTAIESLKNGASDTSITVTAATPAKVGKGDVVIVSDSGAVVTLAGGFTYVEAGTITKISPSSGQFGTRVTITGTGMRSGGSKVAAVKLTGLDVGKIVSESDTEITVVASSAAEYAKGSVLLVADTGAPVLKPYDEKKCGK